MPAFHSEPPVISCRVLHLDLKGTPPSPERLLALPDIFAGLRYNAILVEWEDAFPWTVDARFRSETAYSPETVRLFMDRCAELGIELIPLVQCLGHMETPLALPDYRHLCDDPGRADCLNPLADGSRELVERMVEDVLKLMPDVRHFHLGGDEAFGLGTHPDTRAFIDRHGLARLYLDHVEPLLSILEKRDTRPILWHDMMIKWDASALRELAPQADLMVWGYNGRPATTKSHHRLSVIERLASEGISLWGASAFKGANSVRGSYGPDGDLPEKGQLRDNLLGWVEAARRCHLKGIVATGWSRYGTRGLHCETLEASLDMLAEAAIILHDGAAPTSSAVAADLPPFVGQLQMVGLFR